MSVSQATKLGLRPGQRVGLHHRPPGWALADPPDGLVDADRDGPSAPADVIIAFFTAADEIGGQLDGLASRIYPSGALWAAWPRRAGGHRSDITDTVIRRHALPAGLVDVKVAAIDDDWSGLRLVWRAGNRPVLKNQLSGTGSGESWTYGSPWIPCFAYTATLTDRGYFRTYSHAKTPNQFFRPGQ